MPSDAARQFGELIGDVDQLIEIHARLQSGRGRRHQQDALHRAGVVMAIGIWENYVERVLEESIAALENSLTGAGGGAAAPLWASIAFGVATHEHRRKISGFNTPNSENVKRLFVDTIGFDPWPHWSWHVRRRQWNSQEMRTRLNAWLRIRHGIAHGTGLPTNVIWIQGNNQEPRLTKKLLKECRDFVSRLVDQTDAALNQFLVTQHGIAAPW